MKYQIRFYDKDGDEIASRALGFEEKSEADNAYDRAVADLNHGTAGNAVKVVYGDKQHGVPTPRGSVERVEAEQQEDETPTQDEARTEDDKEARENVEVVVPEEVRNPDAGTLPPHDPGNDRSPKVKKSDDLKRTEAKPEAKLTTRAGSVSQPVKPS